MLSPGISVPLQLGPSRQRSGEGERQVPFISTWRCANRSFRIRVRGWVPRRAQIRATTGSSNPLLRAGLLNILPPRRAVRSKFPPILRRWFWRATGPDCAHGKLRRQPGGPCLRNPVRARAAAKMRSVPTASCWAIARLRAKSDRKSTRLNSSHVAISYAVFCLKKKDEDEQKKVTRVPGSAAQREAIKMDRYEGRTMSGLTRGVTGDRASGIRRKKTLERSDAGS